MLKAYEIIWSLLMFNQSHVLIPYGKPYGKFVSPFLSMCCLSLRCWLNDTVIIEPRCEKTGLRGFRLGPTQTGLYSHRRWLEA